MSIMNRNRMPVYRQAGGLFNHIDFTGNTGTVDPGFAAGSANLDGLFQLGRPAPYMRGETSLPYERRGEPDPRGGFIRGGDWGWNLPEQPPAPPPLPGEAAQTALEDRLQTGDPFTAVTGNYEDDLKSILNWSADPRNVPQYYTDQTVAEFDPIQQQAHQAKVGAAGQYDDLTQGLLGEYSAQLDPNSPLNQRIAQASGAASDVSGAGAGVLGGLRQQQAREGAARQAVDANRQQALQNISGLRSDLTGGADILEGVGADRRQRAQDVINEDIKRFNYAQLTPQQQQDRIISILTGLEGIKQGKFAPTDSRAKNIFGDLASDVASAAGQGIISKLFGGFGFNEGGPVPGNPMMEEPTHQMPDGSMMPGAQHDPMMEDPMMGDPMGGPGMDPGMGQMELQEPMMDEMMMEPQSEIDQVASAVEELIATTGAPLTVTRKTVSKKAKKGG